ncbi:ankyrin repeat domain-containing protein 40 [Latimeria chalumnae]|uniref:Ankyrin repeat domain 40 n=1 Tax=Latimeria chalumnae TaxID=7897 RepID=H3AAE6_LATCH|nr:PREDICTED: ankyrin repeat domain-containing protein 40 [Latimeria chalumnae]|eukprot:XP_006008099.1 PREDICTED: ankyrin repeat domain-containing protein 40 [Latimeria chalumnae]
MTTISVETELEERLREAAAIGDTEEVQKLLENGVNVNSQNAINGWTCLHWACKRNHCQIVSYLLNAGADKEIQTSKGEKPFQLTSKPDIRKILGVKESEISEVKKVAELPIIPNYLANPPFPYVKDGKCDSISGVSSVSQNSSAYLPTESQLESSVPNVVIQNGNACIPPASQHGGASSPGVIKNGAVSMSPITHMGTEHTQPAAQNGPVCSPVLPQHGCTPIAPKQSLPQQQNSMHMGPMPAFQPFFFTGAFPFNMQELVLKVRIQNPVLRENDFIEVELGRQELTYKTLLKVCCCELGISPEEVEKIRKLPNTLIRKDKDVARLQDFQELELVLKNDSKPIYSSAALTERPCYNIKASKLTY